MCHRYGITGDDVFRSVSDTSPNAVKAGLLVSRNRSPEIKGTTCIMHAQELVLKPALGLVVWKRGG